MERGEKIKDVKMNRYSCACAVVASMVSIIFGYDTGVMSGAMIFIKEDLKINDSQVQILAGIINICALVGSLTAGRISDYIGRRYTIALASLLFFLGSVLMGWAPNYTILLSGRCVAGIGVGFALLIAPVYSAEISSPGFRGSLTSLPGLFISIGILSGYVSNLIFANSPLKVGWRLMLGIAAVPSAALAFGIMKMPESPRWLMLQGRVGEARQILKRVSNTKEEADSRLRDIKKAVGIDENCHDDRVTLKQETKGGGVWKELILSPTPTVRWVLLAALGIHFFQHATGIEAVVLYSPRIFKQAGITSKNHLLLVTIGVGVSKTAFILVATCFLDRLGRRKLLLTSVAGMIIALSGLGLALTVVKKSNDDKLVWPIILSVATCYLFVTFYSVGLGPITWVYSSEIFPLKLRAQGASLCVAMNRIMNATVSMTFLSISQAITIGGAFFMFAGMAVIAWFFFFFFLPETKGRTLEEMEDLFTRRKNKSINEGLELQL